MSVVLVTGAGQRIGRSIALHLARAGFSVVVHCHTRRDAAAKTVAEIVGAGGQAAIFPADLAVLAEVESLLPAIARTFGPVTHLVNNACLFEKDTAAHPAFFALHQAVNLEAPRQLTKALARQLPAGETGSVLHLLDADCLTATPPDHLSGFYSYAASKIALAGSVPLDARDYLPVVRVNGLALGPTLPAPRQSAEHFQNMVQKTPLGRPVTLESVAEAAAFLLGAKNVTGQIIALDGGNHLR
jgi:NAD(P)-dependent dehydrogenase (short-subunit alcohol dehydrogenase family)